jgi:hypothetical protein
MRMLLSALFVSMVAACAADAVDNGTVGVSTNTIDINPQTDLTEPAWVNGKLCKMVFPGALTSSTEIYQIWAIGTNGIVNTTYNTPGRPNLYAVFGTTIPADQVHHVDGYNQFDHYHVLDVPQGEEDVENTTWDLLTLWPGPNYNAATYHTAESVSELMAQSAAGILSPVETLPEVGFPELVMYSPIDCSGSD